MQAIIRYLKNQGYDSITPGWYSSIELWKRWYKGYVFSFHSYKQYNGKSSIRRTRKGLKMAKTVAEDWASLALNEKVEIVIDKENIDKAVHLALDENDFCVAGNQLVELTFALGTGAFVEYKDGEKIVIDYIRADMIYPLSWENKSIKECAFASERAKGKDKLVYLNIHRLNDRGNYVVENIMFKKNGENLTEIELPEGVLPEVDTGSNIPLFQIIKPNIINNQDLESPMGISVYGNAIDQIEGCDLVYDSYYNEFRLGKKRLMVPMTMARMMMEEGTGEITPVFDDNDTEFYALESSANSEQKLQEINMEIRADAHDKGLNKILSLLSQKVGMGDNRYRFENGGVKTATEVISEDSYLYQNLEKHELILESALVDMTRAIAQLLGLPVDFEVTVNFDDSIIEDVNAEKQRFLQEIRDGVRQKWEYRVRFFGETEEEAKKMIAVEAPEDSLGFGSGGG